MSYVLRNGGFFDVSMKKRDEVKDSNISENQILDNNKIKVYMVESRINIYNDIVRVMANKLKENNQKETVTSFILPVGSRGQYKRFARICNTEKISCKNLITINMDEYLDNRAMHLTEVATIYSICGYGSLPTKSYGI